MELQYPPQIVYLIMIFTPIFGAVVGSFLNVCIHRLPRTYLSIAWPGSHCPQCGSFLKWYDNIPIFSWLSLGGACRYCRGKISMRYVLVEALTAIVFASLVYKIVLYPLPKFCPFVEWERWFVFAIGAYLAANMIVITFVDIAYRIIPDQINYTGLFLAPCISTFFPYLHPNIPPFIDEHMTGLVASFLGMLVGGGMLYAVGVVGKLLFGKDAMGLGDVKMMAMVGGFLGWDSSIIVFLVACVLGTFFGIISFFITKDRYIPFGPYLAVSTLAVFLAKQELVHFALVVWPGYVYSLLGLPIPMWD